MRKKYGWIVAGILLFIVINVVLIGMDKNNKVDRMAYISDWTKLQKKDMHEAYQANGVVQYADEANVYFDKRLGNFNEFLVKKGQIVHSGDPLFSYQVNDFEQVKTALEQKADVLEQEAGAIETAIRKVQSSSGSSGISSTGIKNDIQSTNPSNGGGTEGDMPGLTNQSSSDSSTEMKKQITQLEDEFQHLRSQVEKADSEQANVLKEQYIAEKEKEHDQKKAQQQSIQSQISALSSEGDTVTVESPYSGRVTELSRELEDPLLTIQDPEALQITGEITEKERLHTEEGMKTAVTMEESQKIFEGEISELSDDPKDMKVDGLSLYPLTVDVKEDEQTKNLLPGYHANMKIFTKIIPDALAIKEEAIFAKRIWVMNYQGEVVPQIAKTGITENGWIELKNEMQPGDWLAIAPEHSLHRQAAFITPLNITKLHWLALQKDKKSNLKYLITGLISR